VENLKKQFVGESLTKAVSHSEVTATLEALGSEGVTAEDLKFVRKYKGCFLIQVARHITSVRIRYNQAIDPDGGSAALEAVRRISDVDILEDIIRCRTATVEARVAATKRFIEFAKQNRQLVYRLQEIARLANAWPVRECAARGLSRDDLISLSYSITAVDDDRMRLLIKQIQIEDPMVHIAGGWHTGCDSPAGLCGHATPSDRNNGHISVGWDQRDRATCSGCKFEVRNRPFR
jgi:hypothetical protein